MDKNIICPKCKGDFNNFKCNQCGYEIKEANGVIIFPSSLVSTFDGYSLHTGLEQYMCEEPNVASDYYPWYIDDNASIVLDIGGGRWYGTC
mgnify:FL=1